MVAGWLTRTRAGQDVLRAAIQRRGLPERLYVGNGAPYSNAALERSCAVLGIRLIHSRPYTPEGRGKLERLNRFIRERFLSEAEAHGIASFTELNDRFLAWAEQVCNTRQHAETGQTPIDRFTSQGPLQAVEPSLLREAFRWSVLRRVTTTASVSLAGNRYSVDPSLIGRRIELRLDPEDLTHLDVFWEGRPVGHAVLFIIGRHVHHQVPQAQPPTTNATVVDRRGLPGHGRRRARGAVTRPRRSNHEPRAVAHPLRLHAHAVQQNHPSSGKTIAVRAATTLPLPL
jgi:putative transposase